MENLFFIIKPIAELDIVLDWLLKSKYNLKQDPERAQAIQSISSYLATATNAQFVCLEYPYIDKLYRNEYYHYYSSKLYDYNRNCIRLSFFSEPITDQSFRDVQYYQHLCSSYLGFLVIRPTFPFVIGRSVLSPCLFQNVPLKLTTVKYPASVNGVKLDVYGFPHAAQDSEMMVCAETTLWSAMEYFAYKYAEYKVVSPHEIHQILNRFSVERQLPSKGLFAHEISYAVKQLGFGVRKYSRQAYQNDFDLILKTYVESGIPVLITLENKTIGHVASLIGRSAASSKALAFTALPNGIEVANYLDQYEDYVFIDDNLPPYRVAPLGNPALHYHAHAKWAGCTITSFIVPLYPKIYLEADQAALLARLAVEALTNNVARRLILRTFLCSSRSFKHAIAQNNTIEATVKELIINLSMPKFVWVCEIADEGDQPDQARGMILIDATDKRKNGILASYFENAYIVSANGQNQTVNVPLQPFTIFNNLKPF